MQIKKGKIKNINKKLLTGTLVFTLIVYPISVSTKSKNFNINKETKFSLIEEEMALPPEKLSILKQKKYRVKYLEDNMNNENSFKRKLKNNKIKTLRKR